MTAPVRRTSVTLDPETLLSHREWLSRFAGALVARGDEIDDVVQQTYVRALERPPAHARNVRGWLGTITRNVVRMNARSSSARVAREIAVPPPSPVETPHEAVERAELRRIVVESVLALDEPYRTAVVLRFFEEQDVATVARLTSSNEETVRTRIRRGVERVRELLERRVDEDARRMGRDSAAARALLLVQLCEIADRSSSSGGPAAAARWKTRTQGRAAPRVGAGIALTSVGTLLTLVAAWWWLRQTKAPDTSTRPADSVAVAPAISAPPSPEPAVVAEPPKETTSTSRPPEVPVHQVPQTGTIHGVVTSPSGRPLVGAHVWAIRCASHAQQIAWTDLGWAADDEEHFEFKGKRRDGWIGTTTKEGGQYEIVGLSSMPGWQVGAFDYRVGAMATDVKSFDHDHHDLDVDVQLRPGAFFDGSVRDDDDHPIAAAKVALWFKFRDEVVSEDRIVAGSVGSEVGDFHVGFRCCDAVEIECMAPGYFTSKRTRVDVAASVQEPSVEGTRHGLDVTLHRRKGRIVRGRVVDPTGQPLDLVRLLAEQFPVIPAPRRPLYLQLVAISDKNPSAAILRDERLPPGAFSGGFDYTTGMYELVVPEDFVGRIDLLVGRNPRVVGTASMLDLERPPDLPCDARQFPKEETSTTFAVRFVDAESKQPIDLEKEVAAPSATGQWRGTAAPGPGTDLERGLVFYSCRRGVVHVKADSITGHAAGHYYFDVPDPPRTEPVTVEVPRADAGVRGVVRHADGSPFSKVPILVCRRERDQLVDATGDDVYTNSDGEFEFSNLAKGDHFLVVQAWPAEAPCIARFTAGLPFPFLEMRTSLVPSTLFRIVAESSTSGAPTHFRIVDHEGVDLMHPDNNDDLRMGKTNEVSVPLTTGRYTVVVDREGCRQRRVEFDVPAPGPVEIRLEAETPTEH